MDFISISMNKMDLWEILWFVAKLRIDIWLDDYAILRDYEKRKLFDSNKTPGPLFTRRQDVIMP